MLCLIGKSDNFGLYRRTISRSDTLYLPIIKWRIYKSATQHIMRCLRRVDCKTWTLLKRAMHLWQIGKFMKISTFHQGIITILRRCQTKVNRAPVYSHRRSGFHPICSKSQFAQRRRKSRRCRLCNTPTFYLRAPDMHQSVKKGAIGQDNTLCLELNTHSRNDAYNSTIVYDYIDNVILPHRQIFRVFKNSTPFCRKFHAVTLRTWAPHRRSLRSIKHPKLDRRTVCHDSHHSAKSIYLSDYLTFSNPTHSRITTHLRYLIHIDSHQ